MPSGRPATQASIQTASLAATAHEAECPVVSDLPNLMEKIQKYRWEARKDTVSRPEIVVIPKNKTKQEAERIKYEMK